MCLFLGIFFGVVMGVEVQREKIVETGVSSANGHCYSPSIRRALADFSVLSVGRLEFSGAGWTRNRSSTVVRRVTVFQGERGDVEARPFRRCPSVDVLPALAKLLFTGHSVAAKKRNNLYSMTSTLAGYLLLQ